MNIVPYEASPCRECDGHTEDCHGKCKAYKAWCKGYEEQKKKVYDKRNKAVTLDMVRLDSIRRHKR